ncbi:hypothetical protein AB1Y20_014916 [Prymnesium parvum]|uniref:ShKT domain-containing protein n=1 Tax=Prymnesium parvum TaxID=97485 RepID=A0AB34JVL5_PRYPA
MKDMACSSWAELGGCEALAAFMWMVCSPDCHQRHASRPPLCATRVAASWCLTRRAQMDEECAGACLASALLPAQPTTRCLEMAQQGECESNRLFMLRHCWSACLPPSDEAVGKGVAVTAHECSLWAQAGECARTRPFMVRVCAAACSLVAAEALLPDAASRGGGEAAAECSLRAAAGECEANAAWMRSHCAGVCAAPPEEPARTAAASEEECALWAAAGECERNVRFMREECAAACAAPPSRAEGKASREECERWALHGECGRNPAWMFAACADACELAGSGQLLASNVSAQARPCDGLPPLPGIPSPTDCIAWARAGECERNELFMRVGCAEACELSRNGSLPEPEGVSESLCKFWAQAGSCSSERVFMHSSSACKAACDEVEAAVVRLGCDGWAARGQCDLCDDCEYNRTFMQATCADACANVARRMGCSADACKGDTFLDDDDFWVSQELRQDLAEIWFRNDGHELVQIFFVDPEGRETSYGVLMPGSRLMLKSRVGDHWRGRTLEGGRLLRDVRAHVLVAQRCACEQHALRLVDYTEPKRYARLLDHPHLSHLAGLARAEVCAKEESQTQAAANSTDGNGTAAHENATGNGGGNGSMLAKLNKLNSQLDSRSIVLLVHLADAQPASVRVWNGTHEEEVAVLKPSGVIRRPDSPHQVLLDRLREGQIIIVRRLKSRNLLMMHLIGDVVISPASQTNGVDQVWRVRRQQLQKKKQDLKRDVERLREQVALVQGANLGNMSEQSLIAFAVDAKATLEAIGTPSSNPGDPEIVWQAKQPRQIAPKTVVGRDVDDNSD